MLSIQAAASHPWLQQHEDNAAQQEHDCAGGTLQPCPSNGRLRIMQHEHS